MRDSYYNTGLTDNVYEKNNGFGRDLGSGNGKNI